MKKKTLNILIIISLLYSALFFYQNKNSHPSLLLFASVNENFNYYDTKIVPFPFRGKLSVFELKSRTITELDAWDSFYVIPYTILSTEIVNNEVDSEKYMILESLTDHFMSEGLDVDLRSKNGCTSLQVAALFNEEKITNYLLSKGASLLDHLSDYNEDWCLMNVKALMDLKINNPTLEN